MQTSKAKFFYSLLFPSIFIFMMWAVKIVETITHSSFSMYGLYPRTVNGLLGILTTPLLHADFPHLLSNTFPILICGSIMFYFYRSIAFPVFFWIYFITGIWVWLLARSSYHIGASGLVYGFISFLFFSGLFKKNNQLLALSLFVTFLYGGIIWGMFPLKNEMSWESHLLGFLAGFFTAYNYRKEGPTDTVYDLEEEEETEDETDEAPLPPAPDVNYIYIETKKENNNE